MWKGRETPTVLGPLDRANLNHWTSPDQSETSCYLVILDFRTMDKVQKPISSQCYIPSLETFRIQHILLSSKTSRPALGPHPASYSIDIGVPSRRKGGQGVIFTTHCHLAPRLRMNEAVPLLPPSYTAILPLYCKNSIQFNSIQYVFTNRWLDSAVPFVKPT
jgi:hypothetical protein